MLANKRSYNFWVPGQPVSWLTYKLCTHAPGERVTVPHPFRARVMPSKSAKQSTAPVSSNTAALPDEEASVQGLKMCKTGRKNDITKGTEWFSSNRILKSWKQSKNDHLTEIQWDSREYGERIQREQRMTYELHRANRYIDVTFKRTKP